jgi:ATP-dependent Zn protease
VNMAAIKASVDGLPKVDHAAFEHAKDKILMGSERKSAVISKEGARLTAFHEGGHALMAIKTAGADPVHKATIMPRGQSLGMVMQLPEGDQTSMSKRQMLARLDVLMGGRVAEELVFGPDEVTSGASSDLQVRIKQRTPCAASHHEHFSLLVAASHKAGAFDGVSLGFQRRGRCGECIEGRCITGAKGSRGQGGAAPCHAVLRTSHQASH